MLLRKLTFKVSSVGSIKRYSLFNLLHKSKKRSEHKVRGQKCKNSSLLQLHPNMLFIMQLIHLRTMLFLTCLFRPIGTSYMRQTNRRKPSVYSHSYQSMSDFRFRSLEIMAGNSVKKMETHTERCCGCLFTALKYHY